MKVGGRAEKRPSKPTPTCSDLLTIERPLREAVLILECILPASPTRRVKGGFATVIVSMTSLSNLRSFAISFDQSSCVMFLLSASIMKMVCTA